MSDLETKGRQDRNQINGKNICFKDKTQNVVINNSQRRKKELKTRIL